MPSVVNVQTQPILNNESGGFPDGTYSQYGSVTTGVPTIAAAGTTLATATVIVAQGELVAVTGASGTNGVALPLTTAGTEVMVYSSAATNALLVYPPVSTASINNGTAGAALSVSARKMERFIALDNVGNYAASVSA